MTHVSRRSFMKGSFGILAALAAGSTGLAAGRRLFREEAWAQGGEAVWKPSFCSSCHYPCCATQVKVVNGVAVEIRGDKASETNEGRLCVRGLSLLHNLYTPYRVQAPMKRTNPEKGLHSDPGWVEITWEEALSTVADKLKDALAEDPRTVIYCTGFGVEASVMVSPFMLTLGTPNIAVTAGPLCPEHFNQLCLNGQMLDRTDIQYTEYLVEVGRTMGTEWCATSAGHTSHWADAYARGMEIVTVNPHCNHTAQRGDWVPILPGTDTAFGLALLYTILHEIDVYDRHFLKIRSNAPYLIDDRVKNILERQVHKGSYVRDENGKPLVWSETKNAAVPFDSSRGDDYALLGTYEVNGKTVKTSLQILKEFVAQYTPEWAEKVCTVPAAKTREIAQKLIRHAHIGATIEIEGYTFPYRPAGIYMGRGMASHMLGISAAKALGTVNVLLGNLDVPGGILGTSNANWSKLAANEDGILHAQGFMASQAVGKDVTFPPAALDMANFYPMGHSTTPLIWRSIADPASRHINYTPKVMIVHGGDPISSSVYGEEAEKAFKSIPFVCSVAYNYDVPSQFCDILLAEHAMLERDSIYMVHRNQKEATDQNRGLMGTMVRRPVVDPVYNTRLVEDIFAELAERIGKLSVHNQLLNNSQRVQNFAPGVMPVGLLPQHFLEPTKRYPWGEFIDRKVRSDYGEGVLAEFERCAFKPYRLSLKESYNYYYVPENAVRLPIYYEQMVKVGEKMKAKLAQFGVDVPHQDMEHIDSHYSGMPVWYEEGANWNTTDEYPFKMVNWKIHYGVNNTAGLYENAFMQEIIDECNPNVKRIWLPPAAARELGIAEGDQIRVISRDGQTEGKAHLSHFIHPRCIGIPGNFGRRTTYMRPMAETGTSFNKLLSLDESTINPVSMSLESSPRVKVERV